jgi:hypothetical protein
MNIPFNLNYPSFGLSSIMAPNIPPIRENATLELIGIFISFDRQSASMVDKCSQKILIDYPLKIVNFSYPRVMGPGQRSKIFI